VYLWCEVVTCSGYDIPHYPRMGGHVPGRGVRGGSGPSSGQRDARAAFEHALSADAVDAVFEEQCATPVHT